jgi:hypothetical protein
MIKNPVFSTLLTWPFSLDYLATDHNIFKAMMLELLGRGRCLTMGSLYVTMFTWLNESYSHINLYLSTYSANFEESEGQTFCDTLYSTDKNINILTHILLWANNLQTIFGCYLENPTKNTRL